MNYKRYRKLFREKAVMLYKIRGNTFEKVGAYLGISPETVHSWVIRDKIVQIMKGKL